MRPEIFLDLRSYNVSLAYLQRAQNTYIILQFGEII